MNSISKVNIVPIREAFPREASNFTVWLEENIDALSERIDMRLIVLEREKSVGSFNVDLFCEDGFGNNVIIENQLEKTDHDHLGKLLTYMVNLEAKIAIWVATEARPEHQRVVEWLNEMTPLDMGFYLVKVEAIRIANSPYAPLFSVVAQPDQQIHEIGEQKKEMAERNILRKEFWQGLINHGSSMLAGRTPPTEYWLSMGAGKSGLSFDFLIFKDKAGINLYIDTGNHEANKAIFDALYAQRTEIEAEFDGELVWQRLDEKRGCRIAKIYYGHGSLREVDKWKNLQELLIEEMRRFDAVFRRRLQQL